jgi:hypothetical protein
LQNYNELDVERREFMKKSKKWSTILIIGSLVAVIALGLMAFSSVNAASVEPVNLLQDDTDDADESAEESVAETEDKKPFPFFGRGGFRGFGGHGWFGGAIDYDSLLADALGITVEDLQAAREVANAAALEEAVAQGYITEEKAELIQAKKALFQFIDKDELITDVLGISASELRAAIEGGKSIPALLEELGMEPADVREAMKAAFEDAVQEAVDAGVITQDQADQLLNGDNGCGMFGGGFRGFGGRGVFPGRGGFFIPKPDMTQDSDL